MRRRLTIEGVVQGVGFRPHVHRLARARNLSGFVGNDSSSVFVEVEGPPDDVEWFERAVITEAPPLSRIEHVAVADLEPAGGDRFEIVASRVGDGAERTLVSPDVAVCDDCLDELFDPTDHRYRYPFITCTNCGPRFTIIRRVPYDRPNTTMAGFELCGHCASQYHDPGDRRFHAQPLACAACGPSIAYRSASERIGGPRVAGVAGGGDGAGGDGGADAVLAAVQRDLSAGAIVAVKGLGGYHLACDAGDDRAVARLRERKGRVDKPFAVMVADLDVARSIADLDAAEEAALTSPARPIVLLRASGGDLSAHVAPGNPYVGVMLPYTPLHHLLFRPVPGRDTRVPRVLVMTSGNRSEEPLAYDDDDAAVRLASLADSFCTHDRPIHVPCDDSVLRIVAGHELPIRRSRGYAPFPVRLPIDVPPTLAVGGELKNTLCVARGRHAWVSQHIGDMGNIETLRAFERSVELFTDMYAIDPAVVAADAHPGYMTHGWAHERSDAPTLVQHHHAHVCALLAESGWSGDEPVIGIAFDGTGYGSDGSIWGGEVLIADYAGFERFAALADVPLPGGDAAIRKPYRVALSHLWAAGIAWEDDLSPVAVASPGERAALRSMLERGTSCVPTSSMGRLFDAVASVLGVRHEITFEGQAAIELEHMAATVPAGEHRCLRFELAPDGRLGPGPVIAGLVEGLRAGETAASLAAAFHDAVARAIVEVAQAARGRDGLTTVGLTGGVFQNALLVETARRLLTADGFTVLTHRQVPPNDGGLSLGQAIAATAQHRARSPTIGR